MVPFHLLLVFCKLLIYTDEIHNYIMTLRNFLPYTFKPYHLRTGNFKFPSYLELVARYRALTVLVLEDKIAQLTEKHAYAIKTVQCTAKYGEVLGFRLV